MLLLLDHLTSSFMFHHRQYIDDHFHSTDHPISRYQSDGQIPIHRLCLCTVLKWVLRDPFCVKHLRQISQRYGFSPVCTRMCTLRLFFTANRFGHRVHSNGLSPVCVLMWSLRLCIIRAESAERPRAMSARQRQCDRVTVSDSDRATNQQSSCLAKRVVWCIE